MELFNRLIRDFSALPHLRAWDDAQVLFRDTALKEPAHWLLPVKACEAVGGSQDQSILAMLAIGCAHLGILLVDDMLDDDSRGVHHQLGMPATANLACAFQAAALYMLSQGLSHSSGWLAVVADFDAMFLTTAQGQFLDTQPIMDEDAYWQIVELKSSPFFGAAFQAGGLAGGASPEVAEQFRKLGRIYGAMIQIHDDLHDSMEMPANPDWLQGHATLPILFAKTVEHPEREKFMELCQNISADGALVEAQEILIRCGAVSYCVDQLLQRYRTAQKMLDELTLPSKGTMDSLIHDLVAPVYNLFETLGLESGTAFTENPG